MSEAIRGVYQFDQVGRNKVNFQAKIERESDIERAVRPYLMSRDIDWEYDGDKNKGAVFAGFRKVGTFVRVDDLE